MSIFVKAHRRANTIVKGYMRSGRSGLRTSKTLNKIAQALKKAGTTKKSSGGGYSRNYGYRSGRMYDVTHPGANLAALPYQHGAAIIKAQVDAKRAVGRALLGRSPYQNMSSRGKPVGQQLSTIRFQTANLSGYDTGRRWSYRGRNIQVAGPVSAFPKDTRLDYKAMVDPHGRYHAVQKPKSRNAGGVSSTYTSLYGAGIARKRARSK